jgi:hypothetical protein
MSEVIIYRRQAVGGTAGEALDAPTSQLHIPVGDTLMVVPHMQSDAFFSEAQSCRLQELMERSRAGSLTAEEQAERDTLIETELLASAQRTAALADSLGR